MAIYAFRLAVSAIVYTFAMTYISRDRGGDRDGGWQVKGWQGGEQAVAGRQEVGWQVAG